jgi:hypothetical protein
VTITGTDLTGATAVTFGGTATTSFTVDSPTTITATPPVHASGAVDVAATTPGGTATSTGGFTYFAEGPSELRFYTITPCRVVDTRGQPDGEHAGPILAASPAERVFLIVPACGVPAGAKVVSANVTVTAGSAAGSLRFYASDSTLPVSTTISFAAGKTRANNTLLLLSAGDEPGRFTVRNDAASEIHVIVDVNGYFR